MNERDRDARTVIAICRQYLDRCCVGADTALPEHLAIELAAICVDDTTTISEQTKREARALLEEARQ